MVLVGPHHSGVRSGHLERAGESALKSKTSPDWRLSQEDARALIGARHGDPFAVLGPHAAPAGLAIRALVPHAEHLKAVGPDGAVIATLEQRDPAGLFEGLMPLGTDPSIAYHLEADNAGGAWSIE